MENLNELLEETHYLALQLMIAIDNNDVVDLVICLRMKILDNLSRIRTHKSNLPEEELKALENIKKLTDTAYNAGCSEIWDSKGNAG